MVSHIILVAIFFAVLSLIIWRVSFRHSSKLPPGPRRLPILGNILSMIRNPKIAEEWEKKYGPIYTFWIGSRCFITISDADIAYQALIGAGPQFSSRNTSGSGMRFLNSIGFKMINAAPYGDYWRSTRRNLVSHVLSKSSWSALQPIREEEVRYMIEKLGAECKNENPQGVRILSPLRLAVCSIFFRVCFTKRGDDVTVRKLNTALDNTMNLMAFQTHDLVPMLSPFLKRKHWDQIRAELHTLEAIVKPMMMEHRELRKKGDFVGDYLDNVLALQEELGLEDINLLALIAEVHFGGIDTSTLVTEWTVGELTANPRVQQKLFEEIQRVVGTRPVVEDDIQKMPYLQAVAQEGFRMHPPLPRLVGHSSVQPVSKLVGYDIPDTSVLLINTKSIQMDPRLWDKPTMFQPERFMSPDGGLAPADVMDMKGSNGACKIIPFGAGRRICPGMSMGLTMVHFLLARLVQTFEFSAVDPTKGVDFTENNTVLSRFQTPLRVILKERN